MFNAEPYCYWEEQNVRDDRNKSQWVQCPICERRTRTKICEDTVLVNFPLYCQKCKKEIRVNIAKFKMVLSK